MYVALLPASHIGQSLWRQTCEKGTRSLDTWDTWDTRRFTDHFAVSQLQGYAAQLRANRTSGPITRRPHVEAWHNEDSDDHVGDDEALDQQDTQPDNSQRKVGSGPLTSDGR